MNPFFLKLGRTVLAAWKKRNFSLEHFPQIAVEILEKNPPSENIDVSKFVQDFLLNDEQPLQTQSGFGQPEVVVYDDPRFYIQVLFWLEGTTDIHQHEFSGAFHVLKGSSIHADFAFENPQPISAHFRVGDLRMKAIHLLETGSTLPIVSGRNYIHSLFHLDMPSISVVVRTHHDPGTGPQFTYLPPHIGLDPIQDDALTTRRKQLLDVLERTEDPTYPSVIRKMLGDLDFERGFFILQNGMTYLRSLNQWDETLHVFEKKHGVLAKYVAPTLEEIIRRDGLAALRNSITDVDHRFFLALLLNVSTRADLLDLVSKRYSGPPLETVLRWAEELMETSEISTWLLDVEFPSELAIPSEKQPQVFLAALRFFLEGENAETKVKSRSFSSAEVQRIRKSLAESSLRVLVSSQTLSFP